MYNLFALTNSSLTSEDLYHLLLEFCIHPYIFFNIKLLLRVNDKSQMYKKVLAVNISTVSLSKNNNKVLNVEQRGSSQLL